MRPSRVLVLDAEPGNGSGRAILEVIAASSLPPVESHYEACGPEPGTAIANSDPGLIVLALGSDPVARARIVARCIPSAEGRPLMIAADRCAPEELIEFLSAGAADFLMRPWNASDIVPRIWRLLSRQKPGDSPGHSLSRAAGL